MMNRRSRIPRLTPPWLAYTDLLSSTLMILSVAIAVSILSKALNQKPPIIQLDDSQDFRFATGSYSISPPFKAKLLSSELPKMKRIIRCYAIDTVEVIGHTDARPNPSRGNLDQFPDSRSSTTSRRALKPVPGSNADLGLLRALSVQDLVSEALRVDFPTLTFKSYSASSYIDPAPTSDGAVPATLERAKRRIELRFTRTQAPASVPRC